VSTAGLRHIRGGEFSDKTAQTAGMQRVAAISGDICGSSAIWMGVSRMAPGATSGLHHHGESETGIYVVSGHPIFISLDGDHEERLETSPGDFVYVPPGAPHVESNEGRTEEAVVVLARSTQEAIVVNLEDH
jgi:uncharacterized RmlC-like cupin family protein